MIRVGQVIAIKSTKMVRGDKKPAVVKVKIVGLYTHHVSTQRVDTRVRESYSYQELEEIRVRRATSGKKA